MSTTYLLDASVLIALAAANHEHHDRAEAWLTETDQVAVCPIVEGSLVRYLVRLGDRSATATAILSALYASSRCAFWPDSVSYTSAELEHVIGHRQVTDAYLASLAARRGGKLATFDRSLAEALPDQVELIP